MQMIGVAQFNLGANVLQVKGTQCALNGSLGADIHKHRSLHRAVRAGELPSPCQAFRFDDFKHNPSPNYYSMSIASPKLKKR